MTSSSISNNSISHNWQNMPGHADQAHDGAERVGEADMPHGIGSGAASAPSAPGQGQQTGQAHANNGNGNAGANGANGQNGFGQNGAPANNGATTPNGLPNGNGNGIGNGNGNFNEGNGVHVGGGEGNSPFGLVDGLTSGLGNTLSNVVGGDPLGFVGNTLSGDALSAPLGLVGNVVDDATSLTNGNALGSAYSNTSSNASNYSTLSNSPLSSSATAAPGRSDSGEAGEYYSAVTQNYSATPQSIARAPSETIVTTTSAQTSSYSSLLPGNAANANNVAGNPSTSAPATSLADSRGLTTLLATSTNGLLAQRAANAEEENAIATSQSTIVKLPAALTLLASPAVALDEESTGDTSKQTALFRGQTADGRQSISDILGNNFVFTGEAKTQRTATTNHVVHAIGTRAVDSEQQSSSFPSSLSNEELIWKQVVPALGGITALLSGALAGSTTIVSPGGAAAPALLAASAAIFGFGAFRGYQSLSKFAADGFNPYSLRDAGVRQAWLSLGAQGTGLVAALALLV